MDRPADLVEGEDGLLRCWWAVVTPGMTAYHDVEWARGPRDERSLFERLSLEALQAGLSWRIVLERRPALRHAFHGFAPERLAGLPEDDVGRILRAPGTIRNRAKVSAIVHNAGVLLDLHARGSGLLVLTEEVVRRQPPARSAPPRRRSDVPARTATSEDLARTLRRAGWRFVGPTTAYAYLQASGWVDDHLVGCHTRRTDGTAPGRRSAGLR